MLEPHTVDDFISILQKCRQTKNLVHAKRLHAYMRDRNVEHHPVLGNYLVSMLIDCGDLLEAGQVFGRLPCRSQYSWSSLIAGHIDHGDYSHAFSLYQKMQEEGVQTKNFTFRAMLKGCSEMKDLESGQKLHTAIVEGGLDKDAFIASAVVDLYGKCGLLEEARRVFDILADRDEVLWTVLIAGYADQGFLEEVWSCLEKMQLEGVSLDASTFVCSLKACVTEHDMEAGRKMHAEIVFRGIEQDLYVAHTLVDMYAKCGLLTEAQETFESLPVQSVVPWTAMISGYADIGLAEEALSCLELMQQDGICPVDVTFLCCLKACGIIGALHAGQEIHSEILKRGLDMDMYVGSALVDMYAKCGSLLGSWKVLNRLLVRGPVAWNTLLAGYINYGFPEEAINCFERMQQEGVSPVEVTFVHTLKACGEGRALTTGHAVHGEMIKRGWEGNLDLNNSLVDFYGKCGSVLEARMLFDLLPVRSAVSWTALISGYAEIGLGYEVLDCFRQMQTEAIFLDRVVFICSLKACNMFEAFEIGRILHSHVVKRGWERDVTIGNMLLIMYAKCGFLAEAQVLFDELQVQSAESWALLIVGYLQHGHEKTAMKYLLVMEQQGVSLTTESFASILKACNRRRASEIGRFLHAKATKRGLELELDVGNMLVEVYSKCGLLVDACHSLKRIPVKNAVSWTSVIAGYTDLGLGNEAIECVDKMMLESICPITSTFIFGFKACGIVGALKRGRKLQNEVLRRGFDRDVYIVTALVDMFAKCGSFAEARYLLTKFTSRTAVTWNALVSGYADYGLGEEVLDCFNDMRLECLCPIGVTYTCVLKSCGLAEALETGWEVHAEVTRRGLEGDPFLVTALVDMYAKCGKLREAQKTFDTSPLQDVTTWNAMIKGNSENCQGMRAIQCFENMQMHRVKPNAVTYTVLLAACSDASMVSKGQEYFKQMVEQGEKPTLDHCTCIVDLLARGGSIGKAEEFAKAWHCLQNGEVLRALLNACKIHSEVMMGEKFFEQLLELDQADAAAYLLMADIYTSAGRWSDAERVEAARVNAAARKMPAKAAIQVNKKLSEFIVGKERTKDIAERLETLSSRMRRAGYMPYLDVVVGHNADILREVRL
ncbi:hypothetical protein GOP47_0027851 [Adiantum capillus-veneris]|nr:hypothetical protein GOP47_0027851 [Adiantum capillus-veneris]